MSAKLREIRSVSHLRLVQKADDKRKPKLQRLISISDKKGVASTYQDICYAIVLRQPTIFLIPALDQIHLSPVLSHIEVDEYVFTNRKVELKESDAGRLTFSISYASLDSKEMCLAS